MIGPTPGIVRSRFFLWHFQPSGRPLASILAFQRFVADPSACANCSRSIRQMSRAQLFGMCRISGSSTTFARRGLRTRCPWARHGRTRRDCERSAFTVSVRCFTSCSRGPECDGACLLVGRLRLRRTAWSGRSAASTMASASARVVLLPLDERLDVMRRDQPDLMPAARQLPCPVVRAGARPPFATRHGRCSAMNRMNCRSRQRSCGNSTDPVPCGAMHLEHVLCEIDADDGNLSHGCPLLQLVR